MYNRKFYPRVLLFRLLATVILPWSLAAARGQGSAAQQIQHSGGTVKPDSTGVNIQQKGKYAFVVYAGGGWFYYSGPVGSPALGSTTSIIHSHPIGTLRIMWHPDHRLRVGIETGYTNFYTYSIRANNTPGKVNLTAIPVLLVWSMAISPRFNIFAGAGVYLLTTNLNYEGKVASKATSLGLNISANYVQPLSKKLGLGAEIKWTDAAQTRDYGWSGHLLLVWKMLEW